MRSKFNRYALGFVVLLTALSIFVIWPDEPKRYFGSAIPWPSGTGVSIGGFKREAMRLGLDLKGGTRLVLQADTSQLEGDDLANLDQSLATAVGIIERRVNNFGVAESEIERQGNNRLAVSLPGISPEQARDLVGRTAQLQFKETRVGPNGQPETGPDGDYVWVPATAKDRNGNLVPLTGRFLKANSYVTTDQAGLPAVGFEFNSEGASMFGEITQRNISRPLGIFLDERQVSAPTVNGRIEDKGTITGVSAQEAKELVAQLNAGALPVPFTVVQQSEVDATLGTDAVRASVIAGEVGFLVVVLFMILLYRLPGLLASLALFVYAVVTLAIFKLVPVTLTLAGIAAFVLSLGIAVDANILIFERMKEEIRSGASLYTAIERGFHRAWSSIRDSNIATLITAFILWWFGDQFGAALVKGFALTLGLAVAVSLFSSIWVTRTFLRLLIGTPLARRWELFGAQRPEVVNGVVRVPAQQRLPKILDLVGTRRFWFVLSILITVPGLISLAVPPRLKPGIEFTSGTSFTLRLAEAPSQQELRNVLGELGHGDARVQKTGEGDYLFRTRELEGTVSTPDVGPAPASELDTLVGALRDRYGEITVLESDTVSAIVSREIAQKATYAVLIATVAILAYITWAFRWAGWRMGLRYGVCAIVALLHDVLVVVGLFSIFGKLFNTEVDTLFITGLLTVIGFSVHDTIVVFDRIRENQRRNISPHFDQVVNESLLQTLNRSLTTSLTVIFTLVALLLFGGETIRTFILVLLIGIVSGTYSSIFVASQMLVEWDHLSRRFQRNRTERTVDRGAAAQGV